MERLGPMLLAGAGVAAGLLTVTDRLGAFPSFADAGIAASARAYWGSSGRRIAGTEELKRPFGCDARRCFQVAVVLVVLLLWQQIHCAWIPQPGYLCVLPSCLGQELVSFLAADVVLMLREPLRPLIRFSPFRLSPFRLSPFRLSSTQSVPGLSSLLLVPVHASLLC